VARCCAMRLLLLLLSLLLLLVLPLNCHSKRWKSSAGLSCLRNTVQSYMLGLWFGSGGCTSRETLCMPTPSEDTMACVEATSL